MGLHTYGQAVHLFGKALANVLNADNSITQVPYTGTCYLNIKAPLPNTTYVQHTITATAGVWQYTVLTSEPGYTDGIWAYNVQIPGSVTGSSPDETFTIRSSFTETTTRSA